MRCANVSEIIFKRLSLIYNRYKLMKIDQNRLKSILTTLSIFIDFRYQSINYYLLLSITIDFIDYRISSIGHAGILSFATVVWARHARFPKQRLRRRLNFP